MKAVEFKKQDGDFAFKVLRQDLSDCNWCGNITASIHDLSGKHLSGITLNSLWNIEDFESCYNDHAHAKYLEGDFHQQSFRSSTPRKGYGSVLHNLLIKYKDEIIEQGILIRNIYSTNPNEEEGVDMYHNSEAFWKSRVESKKAEFDESLGRYKIVWS